MNRIIIKGRLTRDPELKTGGSGTEYCRISVAVDRRGGKEKITDFFDCTSFGKTAAAMNQYLSKGREVLIEGRMESNSYEKDGQKRKNWGLMVDTFEFCGSKQDGGAPAAAPAVDPQSGMELAEGEELPF